MKNKILHAPVFEQITPDIGQSFRFLVFEEDRPNQQPLWHYHPEIELVFVKNGRGKRHIGNHISYYYNGDLIMIGSNLPHLGFTDRLTNADQEIVVQAAPHLFGIATQLVPEMNNIRQLVDRSLSGISFYGNTKVYVGDRLADMIGMNTFERMICLLQVFEFLSHSQEYIMLNVESPALLVNPKDHERIRSIFRYVRDHFEQPIELQDVADVVSMTVPSFCRYFKQQTNKTFTAFVNEFRIVHACKLLAEEDLTITQVAFEAGFHNFSHFSRKFKEQTGKTPSDYRKELEGLIVRE